MYGELMRLGAFVAQSIKWWGCGLASKRIGFDFSPFIHSFHWCVQNATFLCFPQELLPFLYVMYFFLPPFSTNYSSILSHLILASISWTTFQSFCFPNSYIIPFWEFCFLPFSVHWYLAMQEIFVFCTVPLPSVVFSPPVARNCKAASMWSWPLSSI